MPTQLFINLPVQDLPKATEFYTALGARMNPQFSDETSSCMVLTDTLFVMLMPHEKWAHFTKKPIADSRRESEVMLALNVEDRDTVDKMTDTAGTHGGQADVNARQDLGFLYGRSFEDPDGHIWEVIYVDMSRMPGQ
ncbi:VOC family protein [Burkholderia sola]|uniref:VOC family protein n=1 Tax=Burkholderia TaxID=32008 RepID=UPI001AE272F8|nr:VOC family protein [Burkholderia sp. AcTa6-5]MBP0717757.1 VOC family protein [Burkholderia sp. AcTa6-5]